jgi:RNA polymerase sigma-70 factor (ECF subfamily)
MADADVLFAAHRDRVFRYLSRFVGHGDTARDLTQEVFLRVSRGPVPESDDAGRRAWVFRIARNLALNHVRDDRRHAASAEPVDQPQPATQELSAALREALAALPDLDRDVFLLRETAGLSYEEIARACELTPAAVRSRLHRARLQLRATLAPALRAEHARTGVRMSHERPTPESINPERMNDDR